MNVEGNHDCDIETCMWHINPDQIAVIFSVRVYDKFGFDLACKLY